MTNRDKINVFAANLSETGKSSMASGLIKMYDDLILEASKLNTRLNEGRNYLMQVEPCDISVENALMAFGWKSDGY